MKEINWKPYHLLAESPAHGVAEWLCYAGSFIQRLKSKNIHARVTVLHEQWQFPSLFECKLLNIPSRTYARVREVLIDSPEGKWMFARTVLPLKTVTGKETQLAKLKNRSLGSILFKDPRLIRSEFEYACLHAARDWPEKFNACFDVNKKLWARRSVFHLNNKSLLLSEFFSPEIAVLSHAN